MALHGIDPPRNALQRGVFLPVGDGKGFSELPFRVRHRFPQAAAAHDVMELIEEQIFPRLIHKGLFQPVPCQRFRNGAQLFHAKQRIFRFPVEMLADGMGGIAPAGMML